MITAEQLIDFIITNGDKINVAMKDIAAVGLDNVLWSLNGQLPIHQGRRKAESLMWDYFCDGSFDVLYDKIA